MAEANVGKLRRKKNRNNVAYFFMVPFVVVFLIFSIYPVFRTLYFSITDFKGYGDANVIGFTNYARVLQDKFFWTSLWNTVRIWSVNIILQLGLAFLLMMVFSDVKYKMRGLAVYRVIYYLPNIIAPTSIAFLFATLLDWRYGTVNQIVSAVYRLFGATYNPINWMGEINITGYVIAVVSAWMWFGNSFLMLMAGVQGISRDYFEAAAIDGAGRWTIFGRITLPLIKPILIYVSITSLIGGLQMFDVPFLLTGSTQGAPSGSTQTVIMYMYKFGFETYQQGYASAVAYTLFLIILICCVVQYKLMNKKEV